MTLRELEAELCLLLNKELRLVTTELSDATITIVEALEGEVHKDEQDVLLTLHATVKGLRTCGSLYTRKSTIASRTLSDCTAAMYFDSLKSSAIDATATLPSNYVLPCPFCGGKATATTTDHGQGYLVSIVKCTKCGVEMGKIGLNAVEYWNKRQRFMFASSVTTVGQKENNG